MANPLANKTLAELYEAMNDLEAQALEIKAERKAIGDEIRRRAEVDALESTLAGLTPSQREALAAMAQTVKR